VEKKKKWKITNNLGLQQCQEWIFRLDERGT
jgi:hypothetical protein